MRKLAFIIIGYFSLTLFSCISINSAQDFARSALRQCWNLENENLINFALASDNITSFLVPLSDGSVQAVDKINGKTIWASEIGGEVISPLLANGKRVYLASKNTTAPDEDGISNSGAGNFTIRALSLTTGITSWQKSFLYTAGKIYLVESGDEQTSTPTDDDIPF